MVPIGTEVSEDISEQGTVATLPSELRAEQIDCEGVEFGLEAVAVFAPEPDGELEGTEIVAH